MYKYLFICQFPNTGGISNIRIGAFIIPIRNGEQNLTHELFNALNLILRIPHSFGCSRGFRGCPQVGPPPS